MLEMAADEAEKSKGGLAETDKDEVNVRRAHRQRGEQREHRFALADGQGQHPETSSAATGVQDREGSRGLRGEGDGGPVTIQGACVALGSGIDGKCRRRGSSKTNALADTDWLHLVQHFKRHPLEAEMADDSGVTWWSWVMKDPDLEQDRPPAQERSKPVESSSGDCWRTSKSELEQKYDQLA